MRLLKGLFSGWFMGLLLLIFAFVIGYATFVENDYGAAGARALVYNATWFEVLLFLMVVNFSGMIFTKKMYKAGKLNVLLIHLALVVIIIGAGVTRYYGFEGQMHIRDGQTSNVFKTADTYVNLVFKKGDFVKNEYSKVLLTNAKKNLFSKNYKVGGEEINVAVLEYFPISEKYKAQMVRMSVGDEEVFVPLQKNQKVVVGGVEVDIRLDHLSFELPFSLRLNKFDLERYPGSNSPSSFASEITVIDKANNKEFDYRIYMNHILNYEGYRFFQSSYDEDEMGTILSINHDFWGTTISYVGYFLLFLSLILSFFTPKTRFARITQQLKDVHKKRKEYVASVAIFLLFATPSVLAQSNQAFQEHAKSFGELFILNNQGRIEPVNTLANKVLVKISKKNSYQDLSADAVFLDIIVNYEKWQNEPIIKVPEESAQKAIGINSDYAAFSDFILENGQYKIGPDVENAYQNKPALRTKHDKAIINVDERVNVLYLVLNGQVLKIFPLVNNEENKWVVPAEHHDKVGHGTADGDLWESYVLALKEAQNSGDFTAADVELEKIKAYQIRVQADALPSATKLNLEIFYNETNIFKSLFPIYMLLGSVLVALFFIQTFKPSLEFKLLGRIFLVVLIICFAAHTLGLGIRWYISGHAPWSNGYESMIYISWATMLAGFIFMKRSAITLGVTALLAGITLLTAHMSWLNPELTNLVPVLKSHWLTIHVATITASYGFLGLGCMVAFLNLCMMIFRNKANLGRINLTLKELNLIIEMSLSVGLVLLIIGNFLGGIWANESWGRYWGWDPKETWTLVTIILYTFTLHLTLIPAIRNLFSFSFMAFISFGAVLMTYFGVNYYLSGLHSYAAGDPVGIPNYVYYAVIVVGVVSVLAGTNEMRMKKYEKLKKVKKA